MSQRDGSLIRKKQEQWAREREEEKRESWFPFGRPGCGSPNRKFTSKSHEDPSSSSQGTSSSSSNPQTPPTTTRNEAQPPQEPRFVQSNGTVHSARQPLPPQSSDNGGNPDSTQPTPLFCANPLLPYQMHSYNPAWFQQGVHPMPFMHYNMLPPGAIPIPMQVVSDSLQNREPICPVTLLQNMQAMPQMTPSVPTMPMMHPMMAGGYPEMPAFQQETNTMNEITSGMTAVAVTTQGSRPSTAEEEKRETPVAPPRRSVMRREDDNERVERERRELARREEEEKRAAEEKEEEMRKSLDRSHNAVLEALERAKKEAEVMKKARLYKHVIEGSEEKSELEKKLLGVDSETGEEVLKQVSQFERQRKYENEALPKRKPKTPQVDHNSNQIQPRSRASSIGGDDCPSIQDSPLSRSSVGRSSLRLPSRRSKNSSGKENIKWNSNENINNGSPMTVDNGGLQRYTIDSTTVTRKSRVSERTPEPQSQQKTSPLSSVNRTMGIPLPRPTTLDSVKDMMNPLFSPISTRSRKMRPSNDSPVVLPMANKNADGSSSGSTSPIQSPVPQIRIESDTKSPLNAAEELYSKVRSRSVLSSPTYNNTPGRASPLATSIYAKRIAEKGCTNHEEDLLAPDVRRRAEANLSRQSSMASLKGSLCNLRGSYSNLSAVGNPEDSPNLGKYRSMNPAYRSFNVKKTSDRQKETLDRLARLREQLRAKENFMDRGQLSGHGSNLAVRQ